MIPFNFSFSCLRNHYKHYNHYKHLLLELLVTFIFHLYDPDNLELLGYQPISSCVSDIKNVQESFSFGFFLDLAQRHYIC